MVSFYTGKADFNQNSKLFNQDKDISRVVSFDQKYSKIL